jgi:hypothetical protein
LGDALSLVSYPSLQAGYRQAGPQLIEAVLPDDALDFLLPLPLLLF